jgi:hypothetical protein
MVACDRRDVKIDRFMHYTLYGLLGTVRQTDGKIKWDRLKDFIIETIRLLALGLSMSYLAVLETVISGFWATRQF